MNSLEEKVGQLIMVGFEGLRPPQHILHWLASGRIGGSFFSRGMSHRRRRSSVGILRWSLTRYAATISQLAD